MEKTKKAPGTNRGQGSAAGAIITEQTYCTPYYNGLSSLLDQALSKWEHHLSLAQFHAAQARRHRKVLRSLQSLIPPQQRGKGGAA